MTLTLSVKDGDSFYGSDHLVAAALASKSDDDSPLRDRLAPHKDRIVTVSRSPSFLTSFATASALLGIVPSERTSAVGSATATAIVSL
jgi:hypothetical protein